MDHDVEMLLKTLEPTIDKKCMEIKQKNEEKTKERLFMVMIIMFLTIPSCLIFFGINIIFSLIIMAIIFSIMLFITLPFIIKVESRGVCYE